MNRAGASKNICDDVRWSGMSLCGELSWIPRSWSQLFERGQGAGNAVWRLVAERRLQLLATPPLFLEYEDVLKRAEQRLVHRLSLEQVDEFLAELAAHVEPVELHFMWRPQVRDPGDEMVLEAAINGDADALITYNVSGFAVAAERFGVKVLRPAEVLKMVKR